MVKVWKIACNQNKKCLDSFKKTVSIGKYNGNTYVLTKRDNRETAEKRLKHGKKSILPFCYEVEKWDYVVVYWGGKIKKIGKFESKKEEWRVNRRQSYWKTLQGDLHYPCYERSVIFEKLKERDGVDISQYDDLSRVLQRQAAFFRIDNKKAITQLRSILKGQGITVPRLQGTNVGQPLSQRPTQERNGQTSVRRSARPNDLSTTVDGESKKGKRQSVTLKGYIKYNIDAEKRERANKIHKRIIRLLREKLKANKFNPKEGHGTVRCDLYEKNKDVLFEVKSITEKNQLVQITRAIGQLHLYSYTLKRGAGINVKHRVIAINFPLQANLTLLLDSLKIGVIWLNANKEFELSKTAKKEKIGAMING